MTPTKKVKLIDWWSSERWVLWDLIIIYKEKLNVAICLLNVPDSWF